MKSLKIIRNDFGDILISLNKLGSKRKRVIQETSTLLKKNSERFIILKDFDVWPTQDWGKDLKCLGYFSAHGLLWGNTNAVAHWPLMLDECMIGVSIVLFLKYQDKIYAALVKTNKFKSWTTVSGMCEQREKKLQTAQREIREETGLEIEKKSLHFIGTKMYNIAFANLFWPLKRSFYYVVQSLPFEFIQQLSPYANQQSTIMLVKNHSEIANIILIDVSLLVKMKKPTPVFPISQLHLFMIQKAYKTFCLLNKKK